jgi:transketolase
MQHYMPAMALRFLSVDAIAQAQSGHPGMPLGMADIASVLWQKFFKHSPKNPHWFNRDRFILSNGHGSILLYAILHLTGYNLSISDLKNFRQLHSKTPGHPEYGITPGVDTTTGPLGQGLANAVGFAIAEKILATKYNKEINIVDHKTFAFVGDGCLMEGISHEAASLAGTLKLGKLIVIYDSNNISIDGQTDTWFNEDVALRFTGYHWQVLQDIDGHDPHAIETALDLALAETTKPSLIICKTIIGYGAENANTAAVHGAPLSDMQISKLRQYFNWPYDPFYIPDELYQIWDFTAQGDKLEQNWIDNCLEYKKIHPQLYQEFLSRINGDLPDDWQAKTTEFVNSLLKQDAAMATRRASQICLDFYNSYLPQMLGGSADLTSSNNTNAKNSKALSFDDFSGNYLHYGVREFGMAAIMNGIALHGGFIPYGGTFLVFIDYAKNALRLSAMMGIRCIFVLSHDSIGLGEDGPTHQPIEHLTMLRTIPNVHVWRPANLVETAIAWQKALEKHDGPSALILSRQNLPSFSYTQASLDNIKHGAYTIHKNSVETKVILIATGSELQIAIHAAKILSEHPIDVVSMPCAETFLEQPQEYRDSILPPKIRKRIAIEAAKSDYWYKFVGLDGIIIGIDDFGASAKATELYEHFGITVDKMISAIKTML